MRIPLDYYRILGLPIQASMEQLQQAYRDRVLQLPRREYSELAIEARKQLLDEAYAALSDPEQRSAYDASFLTKSYGLDSPPRTEPQTVAQASSLPDNPYLEAPSIEIKDEQFIGALLILQELGEYELVLNLGRSYISKTSTEIENGKFGEPKIARADIVLTLALACLELGREQWQQRRYEEAAETLGNGQDLLLREGLFASVRGELQSDLYKLRPYRILELLALPEEETQERRKGILLLQEMLQERGGMDGTGDDQSGLNTDNFLRFIQQLRVYLTSAEQQALFEEEARRPSAVATYLAVYALLARGFTQRQPELIRRAKQMLLRLGKRQDVYLEQAICALLLGQTEEASRALELSGEYESLAFIREHSASSPDLLPGLCLYSERWLQSEVFPHFRDLVEQEVSLKDYFADEQVQTALESLPPETEGTNEWEVVKSQQLSAAGTAEPSTPRALGTASEREAIERLKSQIQRTQALIESRVSLETVPGSDTGLFPRTSTAGGTVGGASLSALLGKTLSGNVETLSAAERVAGGGSTADHPLEAAAVEGVPGRSGGVGVGDRSTVREPVYAPGRQPEEHLDGPLQPLRGGPSRRSRRGTRGSQWLNPKSWPALWHSLVSPDGVKSNADRQKRLILLAIAGLLGLGLLLFLLVKTISWAQRSSVSSEPLLEGEQPMVRLDQPLLEPPATPSNPLTTEGPLTEETAQQVIQTWLDTKSEAFGSNHAIEQLDKILVDPALSRWVTQAKEAKDNNWYRKFEHSIQADSIRLRQLGPNQARVDARVSESAQHFQGDRVVRSQSWNRPNLRVRYDLVRENDQWRIRDMTAR